MAYEPATITKLIGKYKQLQDRYVNVWYGEAGADIELAKMILDDKPMADLLEYCKEYGYLDDEEDEQ